MQLPTDEHSHSPLHRLRLRRHAQPFRARPRRQGVQAVGPDHQAPRRGHRGRPPRPARPAQQFHGVLLDEADTSQQRQQRSMERYSTTETWEDFYEHTGTGLQSFPIPEQKPLVSCPPTRSTGAGLHHLASRCDRATGAHPLRHGLDEARARRRSPGANDRPPRGTRLAVLPPLRPPERDLRYDGDDLPELSLGQRAFEIVMAARWRRANSTTSWFERHGSTPITELPSHWSEAYRKLVERRIEIIETNKEIGLIEQAGIQAPLERRALAGPAAACPAELAPRPPRKPPLLARSQPTRADPAIHRPACRQGQRRPRLPPSRRHVPGSPRLRRGSPGQRTG